MLTLWGASVSLGIWWKLDFLVSCCTCCVPDLSERGKRVAVFALGLWDLSMSSIIIAAICLQHIHYLPRSVAACYPYHGPPAVQDMFRLMRPEEADSVSNSCAAWVEQWIFGVIMV